MNNNRITVRNPLFSDEERDPNLPVFKSLLRIYTSKDGSRFSSSPREGNFVTEEYFSKPFRWKIREKLYKVMTSKAWRDRLSKFLGMCPY